MAGETTITIVGNLVDDVELRFTPAGAAVAKFRVASTPPSLQPHHQRVGGRRGPVPDLLGVAAAGGERGRDPEARHAGHRAGPAEAAVV
nr:single-stranded DNA-binding protein [Streptomyces sp. NRRL B-1381]